MKFNASMLKTWMSCPLQAKFEYEEKLPRIQNAKASFGTVIHKVLESYNHVGDLDSAIDEFKHYWANPEILGVRPDVWPRLNTYEGLKDKGIEILKAYDDKLRWTERTVVATEHKFEVPVGDHYISGVVDLLELVKAKNGHKTLRIIDYKAQPLDSRVLTPSGWKSFGDLVVGDFVIGSDGLPVRVEGVYPQGLKEVVEVEFNDGSKVRCSEEHLWTFTEFKSGAKVTLPITDIVTLKNGGNYKYSVGTVPPVSFSQGQSLPLDPYLMGIILADGGISRPSTVNLTNVSREVLQRVSDSLPDGSKLSGPSDITYRITGDGRVNPVLDILRELGLQGLTSENKFIPRQYLEASIQDRIDLLAGLMDGDGCASHRIQYRTSSDALYRDFMELCRSLGGVPMASRNKSYYIKDGIRHDCLYSYHISPRLPFNPFYVSYKRNAWKIPFERQTRSLKSITRLGYTTEMQCIRVANSDGLYVTDDYVLTHNTNSKQPNFDSLRLDIQFCADTDTEILTRRGWLSYRDLIVGEDVLTLNTTSRNAEWAPAESVNVFMATNQDLISMEGESHSSLTTVNHRWPVERVVGSKSYPSPGWKRNYKFIETVDLDGNRDRIPCAAPVVNLPTVSKWEDSFVALVAWYWTEGDFRGCISQSGRVNPKNVESIRGCLTALFGDAVSSLRAGRLRAGEKPAAWREVYSDHDGMIRFYLNATAKAIVHSVVEGVDKIVSADFLNALTETQLNLFIDISVTADGHTSNGRRVLTQSKKERLDAFQMACSLAGIRSQLTRRHVGGTGRYAGREQWRLSLLEKKSFFVPREWNSISKNRGPGFAKMTIKYSGEVWCPTTANGTWLARRKGSVYFTGNTSYYYASLQPEFWLGGSEEKYPPLANGQVLYDSLQGVPRKAVWYHLWTGKEIDAGPRDDGDFERLYRLMKEIERAMDLGVYIPSINAESCLFCSYVDKCRYVIPVRKQIVQEEQEELESLF